MICPNCNITPLIIQKNHYFCPSCKIYIGKAGEYKSSPAGSQRLAPINTEQSVDEKKGFIKKHFTKITIILILLLIVNYFTKDLFYVDFLNGCYFLITPSITLEFSNSGVKRALKIIKKISPENYQNICQRVNFINTNIACGGFEGGCFENNQPRTIFVTATPRNITWVAEVLAHEACHAKQNYENRPIDEGECHKVGLEVMKDATVY